MKPFAHAQNASDRSVNEGQRVSGIVVAGTGNGTISTDLELALRAAQAAGVVVWRSTRCAFGKLIGKEDKEFSDSGGLSPLKARIALMLQLAAKA